VATAHDSPPPRTVGGRGRVEGTCHRARKVYARFIGRISRGKRVNCSPEFFIRRESAPWRGQGTLLHATR
jgi:hypothetical protein